MDSPSPPRRDPFAGLNCPTCGYDLRGLSEPRCPECGEGFDPILLRNTVPPWPFWQDREFWGYCLLIGVMLGTGAVLLMVMMPIFALVSWAGILAVVAMLDARRNSKGR